MTMRMGDGPPANLPAGVDAYGGFVNVSGIGVTWPQIQAMPAKYHLSITTNGSPAMCADVERGAMSTWRGYEVGYTSVSNVNAQIAREGRPPKLWTAHYTNTPHICSPACTPGLVTTADGTQWTDHGGVWDESLLLDSFFSFLTPPPPKPGGPMAQTEVFQFKPNQLDVIQVSSGVVWHKFNQGAGWHNESLPNPAGVTFTGQPQVAVIGGACWVTVEDTAARLWTFLQTPTSNTWQNSQLP